MHTEKEKYICYTRLIAKSASYQHNITCVEEWLIFNTDTKDVEVFRFQEWRSQKIFWEGNWWICHHW